jgi:hypothetical protein
MSDSPESSSAFQALTDYLDGRKYNYTPFPEENRVAFSVYGHNADYRIQFRITHEGDYFQLACYYPFRVRDEKLRLSVTELLARANFKMLVGKFEMDMSDGEIRLHASHLIDGGIFTAETVGRIYMIALLMMDRYFPAFMQHIHAGYTPEDAVFHAELDSHVDAVQETPKPTPKAKPKAKPSDAASDAASRPSTLDSRVRPSPKKTRKKGGGGNLPGQGELPI